MKIDDLRNEYAFVHAAMQREFTNCTIQDQESDYGMRYVMAVTSSDGVVRVPFVVQSAAISEDGKVTVKRITERCIESLIRRIRQSIPG